MSRARRRTTIPFGNEKRRKRVIGNVSKRNNPHEVYGQRTDKARIGTNSKKFPSEIDQSVDLYNLDVINDSGFNTPDGSYQIQEITKAINELNDDLRIPFSMFLSGYKYNEIAEKLNVPLGTVKSRIFFARQELQKVLKSFRLG